MAVSVAVVGATGAVGDLMRKVLAERNFPAGTIKFLASERSAGKPIEFGGKRYVVEPLRPEAFAGVQIVLSSTPGKISREYSPIAAKQGANPLRSRTSSMMGRFDDDATPSCQRPASSRTVSTAWGSSGMSSS